MNTLGATHPSNAALGERISWVLRIGLAACFIGHGALGLNQTAAWTSYFAAVGIGRDSALAMMPWVGAFDVTLAVLVLLRPVRALVAYMAVWAICTALLRPLAGESAWEAVERAGNYGAPLALLFLMPGGGMKAWLHGRFCLTPDEVQSGKLAWALRLTTVLLLLGHGALNLIVRKPLFVTQYNLIGLPGATVEPFLGAFECLLALAVLLKPGHRLLLGVLVWKLATEALNPMAGSPFWVFVEHGGSYAAPLAFALLLRKHRLEGDASAANHLPAT
jgi:hypothetical protein